MSFITSQGSGPPGILPAQEGRHTATPDHEDTGEQCGSLNHSGADPSHPGHGPPVLPPAWEPLRHPAAQGGDSSVGGFISLCAV